MISQTAEYALRAVTHLATCAEALQTTKHIGDATKVPPQYLYKVLQELAHAGLVKSHRGTHGGYSLAKPPAELTVWEVVQAVDPIQRILTCPLGLAAHGVNLCPLHRRLDDAMAHVERAFKESTIADILAEPTSSIPLCPGPSTPTDAKA